MSKINLLGLSIVFSFFALPALAQSIDVAEADGIIDALARIIENMNGTIGVKARNLLLFLFGVDLVITFGRSVISNEELGPSLSRLVFRMLFVSFVLFIIEFAPELIHGLTNAAVTLAADASGAAAEEPSVSGVLLDGLRRAVELLGEISVFRPSTFFYLLAAVITLCIAGVMVAMIIVVYAEIYVMALGGLIVLGFAGLESAKDSAVLYIKTMIGKALKLLGLLIIYTLMTQVMLEIARADSYAIGIENVAIVLILQIVTVILIITLPNSLESLAGGTSGSAAAAIVGSAVALAVAPLAKGVGAGTAGAMGGGSGGAGKGAVEGAKAGGPKGAVIGAIKGAVTGGAKGAGRYGTAGLSGTVKKRLGEDLKGIISRNKE